MRLRLLAAATAATLVAVMSMASPAQASHAWSNYHWARTSNPFTLKLDRNLTTAWNTYLATASADWTTSVKLNTTVVTGSFGSKTSCTPITGHVEVCNAAYGTTGWLGIASITITTGNHINSGFVKLNDTYFNMAQYNTAPWRLLVTCQEVGHTFGLGHQDENFTNPNLNTCMDYTNSPASNQHPNAHDYAQLNTIYTHVDTFNTPTALTNSAPQMRAEGWIAGELVNEDFSAESPAKWGALVHGSATRGEGVYLRDFGNGTKVITLVTWA
jgi:hypothetical protein